MPWSRKELVVGVIFLAGIALIVAGQTIFWYVNATIGSLLKELSQVSLLQNEYYSIQGSLNWWQTEKKTTYDSISFGLVIAGISLIIMLSIYFAMKISRNKNPAKILMKIMITQSPAIGND